MSTLARMKRSKDQVLERLGLARFGSPARASEELKPVPKGRTCGEQRKLEARGLA